MRRKTKKVGAELPGSVPRAGKSSAKMPGMKITKQNVSADMRKRASATVKDASRATRVAAMEKRDGRV